METRCLKCVSMTNTENKTRVKHYKSATHDATPMKFIDSFERLSSTYCRLPLIDSTSYTVFIESVLKVNSHTA